MSTDQLEDDWEAAEVNMKALEIKDKVAVAPRLLLKPPMGGNSAAGSGAPSPSLTSDNPLDGPVDAALLNALANPRERMVVFQIENNILNFMNSTDRTMDIPPGYNSFRRLLAYRIGQRFGLSHTTSDQLSENGERGIVLYKTSATGFPSLLLIDMNTTCTPGGDSDQGDTAEQPSPQGAHSAGAGAAPRKLLVMKRKPASNEQTTARTVVRQAQSSEDKERAYLEARARIFGEAAPSTPDGSSSPVNTSAAEDRCDSGAGTPKSDTAAANMSKNSSRSSLVGEEGGAPLGSAAGIASGSGNTNNTNTSGKQQSSGSGKKAGPPAVPLSTAATAGASATGKIAKSTSNSSLNSAGTAGTGTGNNTNNNSNNVSGASSPAPVTAGRITPSSVNPSAGCSSNNNATANNMNNSNSGGRRLVDAGNWKGNRSQVRNIDAERSDPDFVRRNVSSNNNNNNSNNNSGGNSRNQQQQQGRGTAVNNMQMQPSMVNNMQMQPGASYVDPMQLQMQQMQLQYQHQQMALQMQMQLQQQAAMMGLPPVPNMNVNMNINNNMQGNMHSNMQGNIHSNVGMAAPLPAGPPPYMDPHQYQYMLMMQQQQQGQYGNYPQQGAQPNRPGMFNSSEFPPLG